MSSSVPGNIALPESRYDLNTYLGRVRHCAAITDPRMLLTTDKQLKESYELISKFRNGQLKDKDENFWLAKKRLDSTVHPDTGKKIILPFRMSCNVISNLFVTAGMLTPGLGTMGTLFWQWANQSLNVAVNAANANKSDPLTTRQLLENYTIAVSASCGVAVGLNKVVPKLKINPIAKLYMSRLVPFVAVVAAGVLNVFLMRSNEIKKGINVYDENNKEIGKSKRAAIKAVGQTALSRVINATPVMVLPPLILVKLQQGILKNKSVKLQNLVNLGLVGGTLFAVLPFALGAFPQRQSIKRESLESELQEKCKSKVLYFNRGI